MPNKWKSTRSHSICLFTACSLSMAVIILGLALYRAGEHRDPGGAIVPTQVRANVSAYKFVNPLLFSDTPKDTGSFSTGLVASLQASVKNLTQRGKTDSVSVYFRDLNSSRWTGVNEDALYSPGSMTKIVAAMAVLKLAETDPSLLKSRLHYVPDATNFDSGVKLAEGDYRVDELIKTSIVYSDNGANEALLRDPRFRQAFENSYLLFRLPLDRSGSDFMSVKNFSNVWRTLYNSTFFQWGLSEQMLDLLSETTFKDGLVAGLPPDVRVSHKYGLYSYADPADSSKVIRELHDCGIVYYPANPYLICIMTKGSDFDQLKMVVSTISKLVYDYVDINHGKSI